MAPRAPHPDDLLARLDKAVVLLEARDVRLDGLSTNLSEARVEMGELRGEVRAVTKSCDKVEANVSGLIVQVQELGQEIAIVQTRTARHEARLTEMARGLTGVQETSQVIQVKQATTWKVIVIVFGCLTTATGLLFAGLRLWH